MTDIRRRIADLSPGKRALFEQRLAARHLSQDQDRILAVDPARPIPASFSQQRLWFLSQLEPESAAYNQPTAFKLTGPLDTDALRRSFDELVERHHALRTRLALGGDGLFQVIDKDWSLQLPIHDLSGTPTAERETRANLLVVERSQRPFDLANDLMLRVDLIRLDAEQHVLLLVTHHVATDGWSASVLWGELTVLYEAFTRGSQHSLPAPSIQYADFAAWQHRRLQGETLQRLLDYWRQQLAGAPPALAMLTDHPRPKVQSSRGARRSFVLPRVLSDALSELSRQQRATLFMTLVAAFNVLLHRYTGQADIVVGSPISGRTRLETEKLIGFFINTLALRTDLSGDPTFKVLIDRVRETALEAYANQEMPFEKLVEELHPDRDLSRNPLFQVMFVLQNTPVEPIGLPGLSVEALEVDLGTTQFDVSLSMKETEEGLAGNLEYSTDLFDAATIDRMVGHFQTLLEGIVADPDQSISTLPLMTEVERHQLLVEWNDTRTDSPHHRCIHELFEAQAKGTPDAVAVAFEGEELTYRQLNSRANQLAHHLRKLGVGPEVLVGICMERSLEMVVGLLGVLKAGGAYVPLDPTYPKERLAFMIQDTGVPVLLSQKHLLGDLPEHDARLVCLDSTSAVIWQESEENPDTEVTSDNLAYVIYTSGSTGKPKGVMVEHRSLSNYSADMVVRLRLSAGDTFAMVQPLTVDSSVTAIFPTLISGGILHIVSRDRAIDPRSLSDYFRRFQIDFLKIAPSHLAALQGSTVPKLIMPRRCLIIGGEESGWSWARSLQSLTPGCRVLNHYGPTEATVGVLTYRVEEGASDQDFLKVPLGRPISNTQIYLLDHMLQPVPVGVAGELYIHGEGIARGYLNRPQLTAERFIPNPFSDEHGARLYKTGDLARYLLDGNIEFLGRTDDQVKVRGFRVEPGEIEAALAQHPAVREAAVVARQDELGESRLAAYVVLDDDRSSTVGDLRRFLRQKLPDYMVPSAFLLMNALPLTPHGKLDRQALPIPDRSEFHGEGAFVAPRTSVEETLAHIWEQVLHVERVGVHDNFFELGGDSILSIQVIDRANRAGVGIIPRHLFEHQTVAELAALAGTTQSIKTEQGLTIGPVPLTPIQQMFFERDLANQHHWNMTRLLETKRRLDASNLEEAVQHLIEHHDALRLRFSEDNSGWQQENVGLSESVPFSRVDFSGISEQQLGGAIEATATEVQTSLNLSEGPILRVVLFDLGEGRPSRLLFAIHHLVVDGVSWRILLEDLETAYVQLSRGEAVQLPQKTTSFKHWASRLKEHAQGAALRDDRAHWLSGHLAQPCRLPTDYPVDPGTNSLASESTVYVELDAEETQALLHEVLKTYHAQINDVLLTALVRTLSEWTGAKAHLIDLEGHGREEIVEDVDLSRTVGWFTTMTPILLQAEASDPAEALRLVKDQLQSVPRRGIGYGLLRYLSGQSDVAEKLRRLPQPEVSFNYLGQLDQMLAGSSLLRPARESVGASHSEQGARTHLIEVNGLVRDGRLKLGWSFSENVHRRSTVQSLAEGFVETLRTLIAERRRTH